MVLLYGLLHHMLQRGPVLLKAMLNILRRHVQDFRGLKPTYSLIRSSSTVGVLNEISMILRIQQYSEGVRQTMDHIGVVARLEEL